MSSRLDQLFKKAIEESPTLLQKFEEFICTGRNAHSNNIGHKAFRFEIPPNFRGEPVYTLKAYFKANKFVENQNCTNLYTMPPCQFAFTKEIWPCQWQTETVNCNLEDCTHILICF